MLHVDLTRSCSHRAIFLPQGLIDCPTNLLHDCGSSGQPRFAKTVVLIFGKWDQNPSRKFLHSLVSHARFLRRVYTAVLLNSVAVYTAGAAQFACCIYSSNWYSPLSPGSLVGP